MSTKYSDMYDDAFYGEHIDGMSESAATILAVIYEVLDRRPQKVIDIGCGQGAWLAAAERLGAKQLKGLDGEWVRRDALISKNIEFVAVNLDRELPRLDEAYDLCICLEVAEHVNEVNAKRLIDYLCSASDTVLFGAAVKHQGGTNHVNEQWQSYWIELFRRNGYRCVDIVRGAVWNDSSVEWWYRQNSFLFVGPGNTLLNGEKFVALHKPILDVAHPLNYEEKANRAGQIDQPTLRFCVRCFQRYLSIRWRRLVHSTP